jgi:hypothetical protein
VKKLSAFILAVSYFSFTVGATLHQHYCMGKLIGTSLFDLSEKECGKCGMKKHTEAGKDCCKDVSIVIKTGDSHTFSQVVYDLSSISAAAPAIYFAFTNINFSKAPEKLYRVHGPPVLKNPLFIQFMDLRI